MTLIKNTKIMIVLIGVFFSFFAYSDECFNVLSPEIQEEREHLKKFIGRLGDFKEDAYSDKSPYYYSFVFGEYARALRDNAHFRDQIRRMSAYKPNFLSSHGWTKDFIDLWLNGNGFRTPQQNIIESIKSRVAEYYRSRFDGAPSRPPEDADDFAFYKYGSALEDFKKHVLNHAQFNIQVTDYVEEFVPGGEYSSFGIPYTEPDKTLLTVVYEVEVLFEGEPYRFAVSHTTQHVDYQGFDDGNFWNTAVDFDKTVYDGGLKVFHIKSPIEEINYASTFYRHDKRRSKPTMLEINPQTENSKRAFLNLVGAHIGKYELTPDRAVITELRRVEGEEDATAKLAALMATGQEASEESLALDGKDGAPGIRMIFLSGNIKLHKFDIWLKQVKTDAGKITYLGSTDNSIIILEADLVKGNFLIKMRRLNWLLPLNETWSAEFNTK